MRIKLSTLTDYRWRGPWFKFSWIREHRCFASAGRVLSIFQSHDYNLRTRWFSFLIGSNKCCLSFSNRSNRGLINGLRELSRMLFGTWMDEDVEDLRERYNHLASLVANQNKTINMNSLHNNRFEHAVQDLPSFFRVKDLQIVLMKGEKEHQLAHFFVAHAIHHYYPQLESKDDFDVFHIQPIPFSVSG